MVEAHRPTAIPYRASELSCSHADASFESFASVSLPVEPFHVDDDQCRGLLIRDATPDDAAAVAEISSIITAGIYTVFETPFTVAEERLHLRVSSRRVEGFRRST